MVGRHVHEVNLFGTRHDKLAAFTRGNQVHGKIAAAINGGIGLSDDMILFFQRREITDAIRHPAVFHFAIGRFDKAKVIDAGIGRQGRNQADVGTFRRLDWTDTAVMSRMHVADLEAGSLTCQTAGP